MKASAKGHLKVVKALAGEYGADVNIETDVSCVHQPQLTLLLGCVWCTANMYIATVVMLKCWM